MSSLARAVTLLTCTALIETIWAQTIDQGNIFCESKTSTLGESNEIHRYSFTSVGTYQIKLSTCSSTDDTLDTVLNMYQSDGKSLVFGCDNNGTDNSRISCDDPNPCGLNKETMTLKGVPPGDYFMDVGIYQFSVGCASNCTYTLEMACDTNQPTTNQPTNTYPTTNQPTTSIPTTLTPTTNIPTTSVPTTFEPTTSSPTPQECTIFLKMNMNNVPGEWTQLSTYAAQTVTGSPECFNDGERCWKMGQYVSGYCYYSRIISTIGYQNISLMFHLYETGLESDEYCRIKYKLPNDVTTTKIFEQHGHEDIFGEKTVILPPAMWNQNNLTFFLESDANGGTSGNEFCYFDNIYLCGFPAMTQGPTPPTTIMPTTISPNTNIPTTTSPTTNIPTTASPNTNIPTTISPTTNMPTSIPTSATPTTASPNTNIPTTASPNTNIPTTNIPSTNIPTTNVPTTNIPTTSIPTTQFPTSNPTTLSPVLAFPHTPTNAPIRDGEQPNTFSTEQTEVNKNFSVGDENDMDMVTIIGILAALIAFIVIVIALVCCYRIRTQKRYGDRNDKDGMEMVEMSSPDMGTISPNNGTIMRISSLSDANSDNDVMNNLDLDIVKNATDAYTHGKGTSTGGGVNSNSMNQDGEGDGDGTDNELLYEGNDNENILPNDDMVMNTPGANVQTPQGPQYQNENENENIMDESEEDEEEDNDNEMYGKGVKTKQ